MSPCLHGNGCTIHPDMSNEKGMEWQMLTKLSFLSLERNSEASDNICQVEQNNICWFYLCLLS